MAEEEDAELGHLCKICQNFRDDFGNRIKESESVLRDLLPHEVQNLRGSFQNGTFSFDYVGICLEIAINLSHRFPIQCRIDNKELSRKEVDAIRLALRIYLAEEASAFQGWTIFEIGLAVLRLVEETTSWLLEMREEDCDDPRSEFVGIEKQSFGWSEQLPDWLHESPAHILGATPGQICETIAPRNERLRVVHCENVMRWNLRRDFILKQEKMRLTLGKLSLEALKKVTPPEQRRGKGSALSQKEEIIDYLLKPRITFHGTRKESVASIVRYGFIKPGDKHPGTGEEMGVRCGSTYGRGIYSSPDPSFAIGYSTSDAHQTTSSEIPGFKLIVCATIMGRASSMFRDDNWRQQERAYNGADSHVANDELEYIVFDSAQIMPCYVVHLDWGESPKRTLEEVQSRASRFRKAPRVPISSMSPGERQRLKEERLAQARKFFAYGYGPVSGNKIIIEDIADSDDDEEEYGEYQGDRVEINHDAESVWDWKSLIRGDKRAKDQYSAARHAT